MNPSTDLCVATMIRAMSDVIIPALDESHGLAAEQAALVLGHLHVLRGQLEHIEAFERLEHQRASALATDVLAAMEADTVTAAERGRLEAELSAPSPIDTAGLHDGAERIRAAVEDLVRAGGDVERGAGSVRAAVIAHERTSADDNRTWFGAMGWESGESRLGSIADLLDANRTTATTGATA